MRFENRDKWVMVLLNYNKGEQEGEYLRLKENWE